MADLAVECWRLERWLRESERPNPHAQLAARRLRKFLEERELSTLDFAGRRYEPGLAVEVLDVVKGVGEEAGAETVDETVAPVVLWRGRVVRHGQVVLRRVEGR